MTAVRRTHRSHANGEAVEPGHSERKTVGQRGFVAAVGCAAITVAGLAGCSNNKPSPVAGTAGAADPAAAMPAGVGQPRAARAKVIINGQDQNFQGPAVCQNVRQYRNIFLGPVPATVRIVPPEGTGMITLNDTDPPTVNLVSFNIDGVMMFADSGNARVAKDGNSYQIVGDGSGPGTRGRSMCPVRRQTSRPYR